MVKKMEESTAPVGAKIPTIRISKLAENASICMVVPLGDPNDSTSLRGVTPVYWGLPGIGKSAIIRQAARMAMLHCETMYPSHHNPEDFSGITVPDAKEGFKTVCGLPQVRRLIAKGEGVLFVDEIGNVPPALQSAMLSLILERNVGDDILPPGVRLLAAANPVECAAGGFDFEAPTANRFLHFNAAVPLRREWLAWYLQESAPSMMTTDNMWEIVTNNWPTAYPRAKGLISGFIEAKGDEILHNLPGEEDPSRSRAWSSPRMWDLTGRCMATLYALGKEDLVDTFIEACVGDGAATMFSEWRAKANLPTPEDMLRHGWSPDRRRADITIGALASMTEFVVNSTDPKLWAVPAWGILDKCCQVGFTDLAMGSTERFIQAGLADENMDSTIVQAAKPVIRHMSRSRVSSVMMP